MRSSKLLLAIAACAISMSSFAQVKSGDNPTTVNGGSVLELESTNKGLLLPRIALTNTLTWGLLGTPVAGMHVFNTNTSVISNPTYPTLSAKIGEYYWDGGGWVALAPVRSIFLSATGNSQLVNTGSNDLLFQNELVDKANNFDPATSTFTASSGGIYLITSYLRFSADPANPRPRVGFATVVDIVGGASTQITGGIALVDDWGFSTGAIQIQLTSGQQVRLRLGVTAAAGDQRLLDIKRLEITKIAD